MTTHDAELSDIYVDDSGKLWRVIITCSEQTVTFEAVEGHLPLAPSMLNNMAAQANVYSQPQQPSLIHPRKTGGVNGAMWQGWKRIYRPEPKSGT
jgi:hypothetical protein